MQATAHELEMMATGTTVPTDSLISAWGAQSGRTIARLHLLDEAAWDRPTRCAAWNVRQLVQHLVTTAERAVLLLDPELGPTQSAFTAMDPRLTPLQWLEVDGDAPPDVLLARYRAVTAAVLDRASTLVRRQARFSVEGPIGRVPWELFLLHGLWDAWMHERDACLAESAPGLHAHELELELVGTYSLYIAAEAARLGGRRLSAQVCLDGPGGGTWVVAGAATTSVRRLPGAGIAQDGLALVTGPAIEVFEALCGRGRPLRALLSGDADIVTGLSALATFFTATRAPA